MPIQTAILSFGMSGQVFHAPFIHVHPEFQFYAVWERSKNIAEGKYPGVKTYRTLEDLLEDEVIELVIVNTPNGTHYAYAKQCLLAGKHVIVEKPFTVTVAEAEELDQLAQSMGLMLSVYQNRRYDSDYKAIKKVVNDGLLGQIVEAEFHYDRYNQALSPKVHKETPGPGTGALYDLGSHLIDQALELFGMPMAVFADLRIIRPVSLVEDYFELLLYYPGLRVRLHCSYLVREALPAYSLHGTLGSFIKHKSDVQETALQNGSLPGSEGWGIEPGNLVGLLHTEIDGTVHRENFESFTGNYMDYFEGIFQTLRHGQPPPVTSAEGTDVIRIIEAAIRSNHEEKLVRLLA